MMRNLLIALALVMVVGGEGWAEEDGDKGYLTGDHLYNLCTSKIQYDTGECLGYIAGTFDSIVPILEPRGSFCLPKPLRILTLELIVKNYLKLHPEKFHYSGAFLILSALEEAFPCKK